MSKVFRGVASYQYGYCYIFAIALAHVFDKGITIAWDIEATDDDLNLIGEDCLVHAFVTLDNVAALDAGGFNECLESMVEGYPCSALKIECVSIACMYRIIKHKGWEMPTDNEIDLLIAYISENKEQFVKPE